MLRIFLSNMETQRTTKQNKSLHLFCEQLAQELNDHGITQSVLLQGLEIDNSMYSVKDLFRALGQAKYGKKSTTELTTKEMTDVYDEVNRIVSKWGISVMWPSEDTKNFLENYK